MSDKEPVVIKNSKPHELAFSEATGKITRKVNRFSEETAANPRSQDDTQREESAAAKVNIVRAADEGEPAAVGLKSDADVALQTEIRLKAEAGKAEPNILKVNDGASTSGEPLILAKMANEQASRLAVEVAASSANMLHPASGGAGLDDQLLTPERTKDTVNLAFIPLVDSEQAPALVIPTGVVREDNRAAPVGEPEAPNIMRGDRGVVSNNVVVKPRAEKVAPNLLKVDEGGAEENILYVAPGSDQSAPNIVTVEAGTTARTAGPGPAEPLSGNLLAEANIEASIDEGGQRPAVEPAADAGKGMLLKISAGVETHLHAVEEETARINQQLERLHDKFARIEKSNHK